MIRPAGTVREELARIAQLAWPVVVAQLGMMAMGVTDMVMVGRLGPDALASLGIANTWAFGTLLVGIGTASGIDPLVAQAYGANRPHDAGRALVRGAVVMAGVAAAITLAHWYAAEALTLLGQPADLIPTAATYCRVIAPSVPIFMVFALLRSFLQGSGQMRAPMVAVWLGNAGNVVADYGLIYGAWGLPELGVVGAAGATVAVRIAMTILLFAMALPELRRAWPGTDGLFTPGEIGRVAGTALPVGVQLGTEVWAFSAVSVMAGWLGTIAVAAHTTALSLASITFMVPLGISSAAATRVGNLVGAGQPWSTAARSAIGLAAGVMAISAATFLAIPSLLCRIYLDDPATIALAATILPYAALFQLADGTQVSCFGVLRGLGDTRRPMIANLVGYWGIGLPLGWFAAFRLGRELTGLWLGLALSLLVVAALLLIRVRQHEPRAA